MSLNNLLAALRRSRMTGEMREAYDEFLQRLDAGQVAAQALSPGDRMPAFLLPSAEGRLIDSAELLESGPLVVTFFRGNWCPYCAATLQALEAILPDLTQSGATLVAMTPETGGRALSGKRDRNLNYEILVDVDLAVGMAFGIVFRVPPLYATLLRRGGIDLAERTGNPFWFLPVPATFLISPDGIIQNAWVNIDFTQRAEPQDILQALRRLP
jgi:peroxiredoxin